MPIIKKEKEAGVPALHNWVEGLFDGGFFGPVGFGRPAFREWHVAFPKVDVAETMLWSAPSYRE